MHIRTSIISHTMFALLMLLVLLTSSACSSFKRFAYEGFGLIERQSDKIITTLSIQPGDTIADIGAGGGYFSFPLARATGERGMVYAVDVDQSMLDYIAEQAKQQEIYNIITVLADSDNSKLPKGQVDLVFVSNTYHHLPDQVRYFTNLKQSLKSDSRIAIIELDERNWFANLINHYSIAEKIREQMEMAGYRLIEQYDFLDDQSFLLFGLNH